MTARTRLRLLIPATAVASALLLTGCGEDSGADQRPASGQTQQQDEAEESPAPDTSATPAETVTVPVYFVGDTPQGPRLYREFQRVPAGDPLGGALTLAASGDALDPDYRTLLPAGEFEGGAGDRTSIALPDDSWTQPVDGLDEDETLLAIQQLVYTAQGVLQSRDPITFTDSAGSATQLFGIASEDGFAAADPIETLALMSVTSPESGQEVSGTLRASGIGSSFEANVLWEIRDADGKVVADGFTTAEGWMDQLYPWEAEIDVSGLEPGDYLFVAATDDPSGGEGGGPTEDTKEFTVS